MVVLVGEYRTALQKMEAFLASLRPDVVFHRFADDPPVDVHERRRALAERNIAIAVAYLRAKLVSISMLEAIALETGGDGPVDYFMGGVQVDRGTAGVRIEQFLPQPTPLAADDPVAPELLALFLRGRASPSTFDIQSSPLTGFLAQTIGKRALEEAFERTQKVWAGELSARDALRALSAPAGAFARAASEVAVQRKGALVKLADDLERR